MSRLIAFACLSFSLFLAGCGTPPERRLEPLAVPVASINGGYLTLRFVNPNTVPVIVNRSSHTLYLGEDRMGRIDDRTVVGVPPTASVPQAVPLPAAMAEKVQTYLSAHPGQVRATVESSLEIAVSGDDTLKMQARGSGVIGGK